MSVIENEGSGVRLLEADPNLSHEFGGLGQAGLCRFTCIMGMIKGLRDTHEEVVYFKLFEKCLALSELLNTTYDFCLCFLN